MSKKLVQSVVIILAFLIICCFLAVIAGIYLKISGNQNNFNINLKEHSIGLNKDEKIVNIEVIDKNKLLIVISNSLNTYAVVYDRKKATVISTIKR